MEAIIFDYGGVICFHPSDEKIDAMAQLCGLDRETFLQNYWAPRNDYDRGDFEPAEYWQRFAKSVGREYTDAQIEEFRRRDVDFWLTLDDRMVRWIDDMRIAGIKLGLISNLPRDLGEHLREHTPLFSMFHHVTLSYEQKVVKPDPAIYLDCVNGLGVKPEHALFLDDKDHNVRGAEAAGLKSIRFETPEQLAQTLGNGKQDWLPYGTPPIILG